MNDRHADFDDLQAFVRGGNQDAFSGVVRRHLDLVYGTALRKVTDPGVGQEIAQNVFCPLARKAWQFAPDDSLPAWLHQTAFFESKECLDEMNLPAALTSRMLGWLQSEAQARLRKPSSRSDSFSSGLVAALGAERGELLMNYAELWKSGLRMHGPIADP